MQRLALPWLILPFLSLLASPTFAAPPRLADLEAQMRVLEKEASDAYTRGEYAGSVTAYEQLLDAVGTELFPDRTAGIFYNLACSAALAGEPEKAIRALQSAVDAGWQNPQHLARDTDLDSIRDTPEFREIATPTRSARRCVPSHRFAPPWWKGISSLPGSTIPQSPR